MSKLIFKQGNIFETSCETIVCPVNCFGIMGAGLAKSFRDKKEFEDQNKEYREACVKGVMSPGSILYTTRRPWKLEVGKDVIYFPTKMDWRDDSKMEWVENGLLNLVRAMQYYSIPSIALPAVGSGKGNLPWPSVEMIIKTIFENDGQSRLVEVYLPHENV
jgi:O-acetyl-ADP-ribose deacetylase (regulator of RNase III)